jgi:hypothetical protein
MEHRGAQFYILQTACPNGFKWIVDLPDGRRKTGETFSRSRAISLAVFAIDKALKTNTGGGVSNAAPYEFETTTSL